ncbi:hypothetical protein PHYSODRAFT_474969, partial [Phytophthora sojae]
LDLAARGCLSDGTMSMVSTKLFGTDQRVTVVDPAHIGAVLNGALTVNTNELADILAFRATEFIIFPTNCNGNHWCSIMVRQRNETVQVCYYDPMRSNYTMHIRAVAHKLAGLIQAGRRGVKIDTLEYDTDVGTQLNNYNCGIYILLGFEHFIGAPALGELDKKKLQCLRCRYLNMCYQ